MFEKCNGGIKIYNVVINHCACGSGDACASLCNTEVTTILRRSFSSWAEHNEGSFACRGRKYLSARGKSYTTGRKRFIYSVAESGELQTCFDLRPARPDNSSRRFPRDEPRTFPTGNPCASYRRVSNLSTVTIGNSYVLRETYFEISLTPQPPIVARLSWLHRSKKPVWKYACMYVAYARSEREYYVSIKRTSRWIR